MVGYASSAHGIGSPAWAQDTWPWPNNSFKPSPHRYCFFPDALRRGPAQLRRYAATGLAWSAVLLSAEMTRAFGVGSGEYLI